MRLALAENAAEELTRATGQRNQYNPIGLAALIGLAIMKVGSAGNFNTRFVGNARIYRAIIGMTNGHTDLAWLAGVEFDTQRQRCDFEATVLRALAEKVRMVSWRGHKELFSVVVGGPALLDPDAFTFDRFLDTVYALFMENAWLEDWRIELCLRHTVRTPTSNVVMSAACGFCQQDRADGRRTDVTRFFDYPPISCNICAQITSRLGRNASVSWRQSGGPDWPRSAQTHKLR
jgi:hypothetical protein